MPRRAPGDDAAILEATRAALDASLQEGYARLRKDQKAAWSGRFHELAAWKRTLERATVILALYDSDRCWLPAFMREHGMSGVGEELTAFDEDLCSKFLSLHSEEAIPSAPPETTWARAGSERRRPSSRSTNSTLGYRNRTNAMASLPRSATH